MFIMNHCVCIKNSSSDLVLLCIVDLNNLFLFSNSAFNCPQPALISIPNLQRRRDLQVIVYLKRIKQIHLFLFEEYKLSHTKLKFEQKFQHHPTSKTLVNLIKITLKSNC